MVIRVGLLGASRIAPVAMIEPARRRDDIAIVAVAARSAGCARAYANQHGIGTVCESYADLVSHPDVDVVYCALAPSQHLEVCLAALENGKALLIEKPFAMNALEAARIAEAASRSGRVALEAFHYRFHSLFREAEAIVASGEIGRIVEAEGVFDIVVAQSHEELRWKPELGGGATMDLGCYVVHALRTLVGQEPDVVHAEATLIGGVDAEIKAAFAFPDGAGGQLSSSMLTSRRDWIKIVGVDGSVTINDFVNWYPNGSMTVESSAGTRTVAATGPSSYDAQLDHLVAVMRGECAPLTGGVDAVATMTVIDAMRLEVGMQIDACAAKRVSRGHDIGRKAPLAQRGTDQFFNGSDAGIKRRQSGT